MVSGFFAGGLAKGLQAGAQMDRQDRLVAIQEAQEGRAAEGDLMNQARQQLSTSVTNITETAKRLRESGKSNEEIINALSPAIESAEGLGTQIGLPPGQISQRLNAELSAPATQAPDFNTLVKQNVPRIEEFIKAAEKSGADLTTLADSPQFQSLVQPITQAAAQAGQDPQQIADQINARIQSAAIRSGQADVQGNVVSGGGVGGGADKANISTLISEPGPADFLGIKLGEVKEPGSPTQRKLLAKKQDIAVNAAQLSDDIFQHFQLIQESGSLGPITENSQPLVRAFSEIGIRLREDQPILEALGASQNQLALKFRDPEGGFGGLTGSASDRDVAFLKSIPGGIGNTKEGAMLASFLLAIKVRRKAEIAQLRANLAERGEGSKASAVVERYTKQVDSIRPEEQQFIQSLINRAQGGELDSRPATELSDDEVRQRLGL